MAIRSGLLLLLAVAAPLAASTAPPPARAMPVEEASIDRLGVMLASGSATSEGLTRAYRARIAAMDRRGPGLHAVIALNPDALAAARASDARRRAGTPLGPLDGIPVLVKDNIETRDPIATTAGSLVLKDNVTGRDAPLVAYLRRAGAIILGKTNLSEWANIRSPAAMSGWSAVGGLVRNPYARDRTACGSSSGSAVAVAASFAAAAVGTETDGSVVCPSAMNGVVGFKPTLGLVSRTHVVPISHSQDTPGPIARSVRDVALLLDGMAGPDPADSASRPAAPSYAAGLAGASLRGVRVAVLHPDMPEALRSAYEAALAVLKAQGALLVDIERPSLTGLGEAEGLVLHSELKADLDAYLATTPAAVKTRSLAAVIAFDEANRAAEMPFFGQETFIASAATPGLADDGYREALARSRRLAGAEGIDAMLARAKATLLVQPTQGLPWLSDPVSGDQGKGPSASQLPAVAGYPHLTVPMGLVKGLPVGLSFIGTAFADQRVLDAGSVYERASRARIPPRYRASADLAGPAGGASPSGIDR